MYWPTTGHVLVFHAPNDDVKTESLHLFHDPSSWQPSETKGYFFMLLRKQAYIFNSPTASQIPVRLRQLIGLLLHLFILDWRVTSVMCDVFIVNRGAGFSAAVYRLGRCILPQCSGRDIHRESRNCSGGILDHRMTIWGYRWYFICNFIPVKRATRPEGFRWKIT